jgi:hypothetical protein
VTGVFDDRGVDERRDGFDGRMQESDRMHGGVAAGEERRARQAFAARLCRCATRIAVRLQM